MGASIKSFTSIPGPKSYPVVGSLLHYLPLLGRYRFDELDRNGLKKYQEFGSVVKEEIIPGTNIIWIFEPEDVRELFQKEGKFPQRRSHLALDHYRLSRTDLYNTGGLLPTNGQEWYRLRRVFQKGLSSPRNVRAYLPQVNEVIDEFVFHVCRKHYPRNDFLPALSRLFLEVLGLVAFDCRLNSFTEEELKPESRSSRLIDSALAINSCILKTDNGPQIWRLVDTPMYRKLKNAHNYMESVAIALVQEKIRKRKRNPGEKSLLETYLSSSEVDLKDVIGMSADMLLAGIDTITYSTGFALYHLAINENAQKKLREESMKLLTRSNAAVNEDTLAGAEYLKAVVKESFRLNPVSVGIGRILSEDAIFSGYLVPKGNLVVTQNQVTSKLEKFFYEPSKFIPERWLKSSSERTINPYLVLPFGHGPRACIARRLAEQNMQTVIFKLCRNFTIGWCGGVLGSKSYLINKPNGPLKFTFTRNVS